MTKITSTINHPIEVIAVVGSKGVGKSHFASVFADDKVSFALFKMADPIKAMLEVFYCSALPERIVNREERYDGLEERLDGVRKEIPDTEYGLPSPRILMQTLGTDWGRSINKNLWVDICIRRIQRHLSCTMGKNSVVIVDDVRFANEVQALKDNFKTLVVQVHRDFPAKTVKDTHASETIDISNCLVDEHIYNSGNVETYNERIKQILRQYDII